MLSRTCDIQAELQQLLESRWLKESAQLSNLLRYVVEETLAGRGETIKEYSLGREVFHRPSYYDPRNDAIVRVQASMLRKRLTAYYENEGRSARVRIDLPRGRYIPAFIEAEVAPAVTSAPVLESPEEHAPAAKRWRFFAVGLAVGGLLAVLVMVGFQYASRGRRTLPGPAVWGGFVHPKSEVVVSFGVPLFYGGRGIFARDTRVNRTGEEALGWLPDLEKAIAGKLTPQEDVYTGIGDLVGTHEVVRWLEDYGVRTRLANSHYLGHSDIASTNLVVVSSARFQTLLSEMALPRRISFDEQGGGGFRVDEPGAGEETLYLPRGGTGVDTSYAVLSLWPGKRSDLRILYLSGITTWATQGAAQYLVDKDKLAQLQSRLDADLPLGPKGKKGPFFQILVRVEGKNNRVRTAEYVTHRYCSTLN